MTLLAVRTADFDAVAAVGKGKRPVEAAAFVDFQRHADAVDDQAAGLAALGRGFDFAADACGVGLADRGVYRRGRIVDCLSEAFALAFGAPLRQPPIGVSSLTLSAAMAGDSAVNVQSSSKTCG